MSLTTPCHNVDHDINLTGFPRLELLNNLKSNNIIMSWTTPYNNDDTSINHIGLSSLESHKNPNNKNNN